jgi:hypothetical protein
VWRRSLLGHRTTGAAAATHSRPNASPSGSAGRAGASSTARSPIANRAASHSSTAACVTARPAAGSGRWRASPHRRRLHRSAPDSAPQPPPRVRRVRRCERDRHVRHRRDRRAERCRIGGSRPGTVGASDRVLRPYPEIQATPMVPARGLPDEGVLAVVGAMALLGVVGTGRRGLRRAKRCRGCGIRWPTWARFDQHWTDPAGAGAPVVVHVQVGAGEVEVHHDRS